MIRVHRKVIDPAPVAFVAGHAGREDSPVPFADQKPFRVHAQFPADVFARVVVRNDEVARRPKFEDRRFVGRAVRANDKIGRHDAFRLTRRYNYRGAVC